MAKVLDMLEHQYLPTRKAVLLKELYNDSDDRFLIAIDAYNYGVICGKREERAKRKAVMI